MIDASFQLSCDSIKSALNKISSAATADGASDKSFEIYSLNLNEAFGSSKLKKGVYPDAFYNRIYESIKLIRRL
jgi:hypothetical protein